MGEGGSKFNGVLYDTYKADALCSDFFQDGEHEYTGGIPKTFNSEILHAIVLLISFW